MTNIRTAVVGCWLLSSVACLSAVNEGNGAIGPKGGTASSPEGASIVVPAGALSKDTAVAITRVTTGFPALPSGMSAAVVFAATPHGQTFASPVTIRIPASGSQVLMTAQPGGAWSKVDATTEPGFLFALVSHFSYFAAVDVQPEPDGGGTGGGSGGGGGTNVDGGTGGGAGPNDGGGGGGASSVCDVCTDFSCQVLHRGYQPHAMAVGPDFLGSPTVYFIDSDDAGTTGSIFAVVPGTWYSVLPGVSMAVSSLSQDDGGLYWWEGGTPGFFSVTKTNAIVTHYGANLDPFPTELFVSGPYAYESSYSYDAGVFSYDLVRIELDGGAQTTLLSQSSPYSLVAVDPPNVYLETYNQLFTLDAVNGGTPMFLANTRGLGAAAVAPAYVYIATVGTGDFLRIAKDGGTATVLAAGLNTPSALILDGTYAYISTGDGIAKVDVTSGAVDLLVPTTVTYDAGSAGEIGNIALDKYFVYWTNSRCGTVSSRAK